MTRDELLDLGEWAVDVAEHVLNAHDVEHYPTVIRNRKGSYHHRVNGTSQIVLGWESVRRAYEEGFHEYPSIAYIWRGQGELRGDRGVWALVLHEAAHAMQARRVRGSCHNETFIRALGDLIARCPLEG